MSADLFTLADERLVRIPSHSTSVDAAKSILPCRAVLKQQIMTALKTHGPMTDGELERLPQFSHYGHTTVRKRRGELYKHDLTVIDTGEVRNRMIVWAAK